MPTYTVNGAAAVSIKASAHQGSELVAHLWFDETAKRWWHLSIDQEGHGFASWVVGPLAHQWSSNVLTFQEYDQHKPAHPLTFDPQPGKVSFNFDLDARVGSLSGGEQLFVVELVVEQGGVPIKPSDGDPYVVVGKGTTAPHWDTITLEI